MFTGAVLLICYRMKESSTGRGFLAIREDEIAAQAMGVNVTQLKVRAFVLSSALAGVAGGVFAHQSGVNLNAGELNFVKSFDILIMVVLGGLGSISGATLAAVILTFLPEALRDPPHPWPYVLAFVIIACLMIALKPAHGERTKGAMIARMIGIGVLVGVILEGVRSFAISRGVNLAEYRMIIYALALILMMIIRPQGLFGVHEIWKRSGRRPHSAGKPA
jgi:branched-chain amino acid transport system permease protein